MTDGTLRTAARAVRTHSSPISRVSVWCAGNAFLHPTGRSLSETFEISQPIMPYSIRPRIASTSRQPSDVSAASSGERLPSAGFGERNHRKAFRRLAKTSLARAVMDKRASEMAGVRSEEVSITPRIQLYRLLRENVGNGALAAMWCDATSGFPAWPIHADQHARRIRRGGRLPHGGGIHGLQPIATLTFEASSQTRLSVSCLRRAWGSIRLRLRTTVTSSARAAESA